MHNLLRTLLEGSGFRSARQNARSSTHQIERRPMTEATAVPGIRLANPSGLKIELNANGSLRRIDLERNDRQSVSRQ